MAATCMTAIRVTTDNMTTIMGRIARRRGPVIPSTTIVRSRPFTATTALLASGWDNFRSPARLLSWQAH